MLPDLARVLDEAQARQLPALIADWSELRARRWIARALRIDLALVTAEPDLVVPCLVRRCVWPGGEDEASWYRERPAVPDDALAVRTLAAEWADEWGTGRRWLRALRPPEVAVDGGVIEEYRTSAAGELQIDRDRISVGAVAWERATGRRLDRAPPDSTRVAWQCASSTPGRIAIESPARRVAIEHLTDAVPRAAFGVSDRFVVVAADDVDGPLYWLVDLELARVRWEAAGPCVGAVADDHHVYIASPTMIEPRWLVSGNRRGAWNAPAPGELALAGDGQLATRSGDVIRVWNIREAMRRNSCARLAEPELFGPVVTARDGVLRVDEMAVPVDRADLVASPNRQHFASVADHVVVA